jgi:hypothetical protein
MYRFLRIHFHRTRQLIRAPSSRNSCGGREPSTTRTPYPISQGKIWFNRLQDFDAIGITFSNSSKPKNASEIISFSVQASGHLNETTCYQTYDPSFLPSFIQPAKLGDNITIHMSSYHNVSSSCLPLWFRRPDMFLIVGCLCLLSVHAGNDR